MKRLILTVGLPRSGKSTWANCHGAPMVNPDSVRLALHGQAFVPSAEPLVWATAYLMASSLHEAGHKVVIVDATNTTKKRRAEWAMKFKKCKITYVVFDTPKEECIQRAKDTNKENLIPVIERMAASFEPVEESEGPCISV